MQTILWKNQSYCWIVFFTMTLCTSGYAQLSRYSYTRQKMGSSFSIILYTADSIQANYIAENCYTLTDSLVNIFSDYIDSSELNRLSASAGNFNRPFKVSPALFDILSISQQAYEKSGGSFDITLGPITRLWRNSRRNNSWPSPEEVAEKLALTGFKKLWLDNRNHLVIMETPGMKLDLGGIAQGYIGQQVMNRIQHLGIQIALVNVSGDITTAGIPPGAKGWTVAVNLPEQQEELMNRYLLIHDRSVTTSGDAYQYMIHEGKKYSHVVNPATGYGITSRRNVTVIANDCTTADWLTKACSILPLPKAKKLAKSLHAEFLIAENDAGKMRIHQTRNFKKYWQPAQ